MLMRWRFQAKFLAFFDIDEFALPWNASQTLLAIIRSLFLSSLPSPIYNPRTRENSSSTHGSFLIRHAFFAPRKKGDYSHSKPADVLREISAFYDVHGGTINDRVWEAKDRSKVDSLHWEWG